MKRTSDSSIRTERLGLLCAAVFLAVLCASAAGIASRATHGARTTADEPWYLLTAASLADDGDLDVSDELAAGEQDEFHEVRVDEQTIPLDESGRRVAPHDPLLPALLAPAYALGGWVGAKVLLALVTAATAALTVWTAVRRFGARPTDAALVTALLGASAPIAAYGTQVYPETIAATFTLIAVVALTGTHHRRDAALVAVSVIALPWLAVKYAPVAGVLALLALHRFGFAERRRRLALGLVVTWVLAGLVFALLHQRWYGGLTPYATGDAFVQRGELSVVGSNPQYLGRARRLLGLMVDRGFGLAAWSPLYLAAIPALGWFARRRPPGALALVAPLAMAWLVATFVALTMQGWWFPGRQVVVVLPLLAVVLARWASTRTRRTAVVVLGLIGVATWAWLVVETSAGGLTLVVDFEQTANPWMRLWRHALPDLRMVDDWTWPLYALWLAITATLAVHAFRRAEPPIAPAPSDDGGSEVVPTEGSDARATSEPAPATA